MINKNQLIKFVKNSTFNKIIRKHEPQKDEHTCPNCAVSTRKTGSQFKFIRAGSYSVEVGGLDDNQQKLGQDVNVARRLSFILDATILHKKATYFMLKKLGNTYSSYVQ